MKTIKVLSLVSILWLLLNYSIFFIFSDEKVYALTDEDGLVEWLGSACLMLTSGFLFMSFLRDKGINDLIFFKPRKNIFFLLLSLLFLLGFFEEISWGQRIFGISIPEEMKGLNVQNEINIHNLKYFSGNEGLGSYLNGNKLFTIFWATFCCLIPLAFYKIKSIKVFLLKINFPIVPLFITSLFIVNYSLSKFTQLYITNFILFHPLTELKESTNSFLFLITSFWFYSKVKEKEIVSRPESTQLV